MSIKNYVGWSEVLMHNVIFEFRVIWAQTPDPKGPDSK